PRLRPRRVAGLSLSGGLAATGGTRGAPVGAAFLLQPGGAGSASGRSLSAGVLAGSGNGRLARHALCGPCHALSAVPPYNPRNLHGDASMYTRLLQSTNRLHPRAWDFIQLMRLDKPIGIYLLLWPTLWALWVAAEGMPSAKNLFIFVAGVILMRAAGCVINDYADRNFDGHVSRTKARPLASGKIKPREALVLFAVLVALSFVLVLFTNATTIWLSFGGLALAACYPFMKRY